MKNFLLSVALLMSLATSAQYKRFEFRRVQVAPSVTTTAFVALPPGYDSLRPQPYPLVMVGKGLGESFASVQNGGIFGLLRRGFVPDSTPYVFVHLDRGSTTLANWTPFALNSLIYRNRLNLDSSNLFKIGHSAGGGYGMAGIFGQNVTPRLPKDSVLNLAKKVRAVVAQAPNQDFDDRNWSIVNEVPVPAWVIVGANDQAAYVDRSRRIHDSVNARVPGLVTLTVRAGVGHGGWDAAYSGQLRMPDGKTMWQFFTSQLNRREVPKPEEVGLYFLRVMSDGRLVYERVEGKAIDLSKLPTRLQ